MNTKQALQKLKRNLPGRSMVVQQDRWFHKISTGDSTAYTICIFDKKIVDADIALRLKGEDLTKLVQEALDTMLEK